MAKEFFSYYNDNLSYIRRLSAEFAREFPNVAARLDLNAIECQDPFIERLIEGTAFLGARVEKQMERGYSRFLEAVLYAVCPMALAPVPAFCNAMISRADLSRIQNGSLRVLRGSRFSRTSAESTAPVVFVNFFETELHPVSITGIQFSDHDTEIAGLTKEGYRNALTLKLNTEGSGTFDSIAPEYLDIYANIPLQDASALAEYLLTCLRGAYLKLQDGSYRPIPGVTAELSILDGDDVPHLSGTEEISGVSILTRYINFPDIMKYIRIRGLKDAFRNIATHEISLVLVFTRAHSFRQESRFSGNSLLLNVIPLVNLFRHRSARIFLNREHEVNLTIDSTHQNDYELFYVEKADFFDSSGLPLFQAYPFFSSHAQKSGAEYRNFFTVNRRSRQGFAHSETRSYRKQEAFLTFSGKDFLDNMQNRMQFSADCLVTNADLPGSLSIGDRLSTGSLGEIRSADIITTVTKPRMPLVTAGSANDFKRLSYIMCNFASVIAGGDENMLFTLKEMITACSSKSAEETDRLKASLKKLRIDSRVYRFISKGVVFFEKGYHITLTLGQKELEGIGLFAFARVLAELIMTYRDISIPLTVDICSDERGLVLSCKNPKR